MEKTLDVSICIILTLGILQFIPWIYMKSKQIHFLIGNVYVLLVLFFITPCSLILGLFDKSIFDKIGIVLFWFLVAFCTRKSIHQIINKEWASHFQWMFYSYICIVEIGLIQFFSNHSLRILLVIGVFLLFILINFIFQKFRIYENFSNRYRYQTVQ
ncbi:MAG: DUF2306 domain-containing protein [Chitinophagales bacterium]|nr:DUF2306 domain-containing protein [Chitinophagales bacterium]